MDLTDVWESFEWQIRWTSHNRDVTVFGMVERMDLTKLWESFEWLGFTK